MKPSSNINVSKRGSCRQSKAELAQREQQRQADEQRQAEEQRRVDEQRRAEQQRSSSDFSSSPGPIRSSIVSRIQYQSSSSSSPSSSSSSSNSSFQDESNRKIRAYSREFKLQVIADAESTSKRAAASKHGIDRKLIRTWVKSKEKLLVNDTRYLQSSVLTLIEICLFHACIPLVNEEHVFKKHFYLI